MKHSKSKIAAILVLALLVVSVTVACGDDDADPVPALSRSDVQEIAREELAKAPQAPEPGLTSAQVEQLVQAAIANMPEPETGLTDADIEMAVQRAIDSMPEMETGLSAADVESIVEKALAGLPEPSPGLTADDVAEAIRAAMQAAASLEPEISRSEVQRIARNAVASIPLKTAPADYTKFVVDNAIFRYNAEGLEATLSYYNGVESVDGQWYIFIIGPEDKVVGHYDPHLLGEDLKGPVGTDANGYNFGPEMLSATEEGKWVSYVHRNPERGDVGYEFRQLELKNVWVVRHDDLLFASGWYIDADKFTRQLVSVAVDTFRVGGLAGAVEYFSRPDSALAGLETAIAYYNNTGTVEGNWFAFIADGTGKIATHSDIEMVGKDLDDVLGTAQVEATSQGSWLERGALRVWIVGHQGWIFGSGWQADSPDRIEKDAREERTANDS